MTRTAKAATRASYRRLAVAIVRAQEPGMGYIGWFLALVRAYPDGPHDWQTALAEASRLRMALNIAQSLLRAAARRA